MQTTRSWSGQLSLAPGSKFTTAVQLPGSVERGRSPGNVSLGGSLSATITRNEQEARLPAASVAVHCTGVDPVLKVDPEGGSHRTVTPAGMLSSAFAQKTTLEAVQAPRSETRGTFAGQVMRGGS